MSLYQRVLDMFSATEPPKQPVVSNSAIFAINMAIGNAARNASGIKQAQAAAIEAIKSHPELKGLDMVKECYIAKINDAKSMTDLRTIRTDLAKVGEEWREMMKDPAAFDQIATRVENNLTELRAKAGGSGGVTDRVAASEFTKVEGFIREVVRHSVSKNTNNASDAVKSHNRQESMGYDGALRAFKTQMIQSPEPKVSHGRSLGG